MISHLQAQLYTDPTESFLVVKEYLGDIYFYIYHCQSEINHFICD